ncbi:hypothetical protein SAMN05216436_112121 [bacterium A37T11]|nr:hypothetical protein SAMN05216436_112121 [bacterium A37T11]
MDRIAVNAINAQSILFLTDVIYPTYSHFLYLTLVKYTVINFWNHL